MCQFRVKARTSMPDNYNLPTFALGENDREIPSCDLHRTSCMRYHSGNGQPEEAT